MPSPDIKPDQFLNQLLQSNQVTTQASSDKELKDEFIKLQYQQSFETYRAQFALALQLMTVFVVADITIIGYAISSQISGIFLIGSICPLAILSIAEGSYRYMQPIIYVALLLEDRYSGDEQDGLIATFLSRTTSIEYVSKLRSIISHKNAEERMSKLYRLRGSMFASRRFTTLLLLITLGHIIIVIILSYAFQWRFV